MPEKIHKQILAAVLALALAACASTDVTEDGDAECLVTPPAEEMACTMHYAPVCGCDGQTYGNACVARARGVPWSTPGACGGKGND